MQIEAVKNAQARDKEHYENENKRLLETIQSKDVQIREWNERYSQINV
jgi:hypothetical protein